jgi:hypothetical protein
MKSRQSNSLGLLFGAQLSLSGWVLLLEYGDGDGESHISQAKAGHHTTGENARQ